MKKVKGMEENISLGICVYIHSIYIYLNIHLYICVCMSRQNLRPGADGLISFFLHFGRGSYPKKGRKSGETVVVIWRVKNGAGGT